MPLLTYRLIYAPMNSVFSVALDLVVGPSANVFVPTRIKRSGSSAALHLFSAIGTGEGPVPPQCPRGST